MASGVPAAVPRDGCRKFAQYGCLVVVLLGALLFLWLRQAVREMPKKADAAQIRWSFLCEFETAATATDRLFLVTHPAHPSEALRVIRDAVVTNMIAEGYNMTLLQPGDTALPCEPGVWDRKRPQHVMALLAGYLKGLGMLSKQQFDDAFYVNNKLQWQDEASESDPGVVGRSFLGPYHYLDADHGSIVELPDERVGTLVLYRTERREAGHYVSSSYNIVQGVVEDLVPDKAWAMDVTACFVDVARLAPLRWRVLSARFEPAQSKSSGSRSPGCVWVGGRTVASCEANEKEILQALTQMVGGQVPVGSAGSPAAGNTTSNKNGK